MKTLLVLRHAKSSWKDGRLADHDRPLNKRGTRDAPKMGALLKKEDLVPDLIISSTAKRAKKTAQIVAENCGYEKEIFFTRDFYHAAPETYIDELRLIPDDIFRVMIVGHNPGMEDLVEEITGEWVRMPTATIVQIDFESEHWSSIDLDEEGKLVQVWRPKELW